MQISEVIDRDDCKSTSGHVFWFGGGAVTW